MESNCNELIFLLIVIIIIIIFGIVMTCCCNNNEHFSPTGWSANCPPPDPRAISQYLALKKNYKLSDGKNTITPCGPGCVCKNCPKIKGCSKKESTPKIIRGLPLGWGSTVTGSFAGRGNEGCAININGINKMSMNDAYKNQIYHTCVRGRSNPFDR
jgi:hypothetical protein